MRKALLEDENIGKIGMLTQYYPTRYQKFIR